MAVGIARDPCRRRHGTYSSCTPFLPERRRSLLPATIMPDSRQRVGGPTINETDSTSCRCKPRSRSPNGGIRRPAGVMGRQLLSDFPGQGPSAARSHTLGFQHSIKASNRIVLDGDQIPGMYGLATLGCGKTTSEIEMRPTKVPGRNKVSSATFHCATAFQKIARDCVTSIKARVFVAAHAPPMPRRCTRSGSRSRRYAPP